MVPEQREFLSNECNRLKNGFCATRKCLLRGDGIYPEVNYDKATCVAYEIFQKLLEK